MADQYLQNQADTDRGQRIASAPTNEPAPMDLAAVNQKIAEAGERIQGPSKGCFS